MGWESGRVGCCIPSARSIFYSPATDGEPASDRETRKHLQSCYCLPSKFEMLPVLRVLLLIPTLDASGAEKQLTLLAAGLPRERFDVRVVALTRGGPYADVLREAGVPVQVLGKRWKADATAWVRLRRELRAFQPHILHTWLFAANAYGRLSVRRGNAAKIIVSERCVDTWKAGWQLWLDRKLIGRTDALVANSHSVANFYRELGVPDALLHVIPNAIAPPAASLDRIALRRSLNVPDDARIVVSVGRLARQKRVDVLVWATQLLRQLAPNVYHLVLGDGPQRSRLQHLAQHFTCDDVTRFAGHRDDAAACMAAADVFWFASEFEGQSNSLMEAMAAGLPCIVSDIPANRELIVDGETGLLVRPGDSVAFAQYADRLLADPARAQRLGSAARHAMQTQHSVAAMVTAYETLYVELAG